MGETDSDASISTEIASNKMGNCGRRIIADAHRRAIVQMVGGFIKSPSKVAALLADPDYAEKHGYDPIEITPARCCQLLKEVSPVDVAMARAEYLVDFSDTPFAHTRARVEELARLYSEVDMLKRTDGKELSALRKMSIKLQILHQIALEMDETVEKLAEAIKTSNHSLSIQFSRSQITEIAYVLQSEIATLGEPE
jgi:hypothetical protein